jgi:hypothetical protein
MKRSIQLLSTVGLLLLAAACRAPTPPSDARAIESLAPIRNVDQVLDQPVQLEASERARALLERPLTEESAVQIALVSNREIRASLHDVGIARGAWMQARLLPNPVAEVEVLPEQDSQLELRLEYDLTKALLAPLRAQATAPRVEAARFRAADTVISEIAAVRRAFIGLQAAEARL